MGDARDGASPVSTEGDRRYFFLPALTFAHLARCAAAILLRPAAEIVRFFASQGWYALARLHKDFPEGSEGSGYAREFILKARTFMLELFDYGLN